MGTIATIYSLRQTFDPDKGNNEHISTLSRKSICLQPSRLRTYNCDMILQGHGGRLERKDWKY